MQELKRMQELERPVTLTDVAIERISEAIVDGTFTGGMQLAESFLATKLGTSRGTIRAALRKLEESGLVEISAHKGAFVTPITLRLIDELFSFRAVLESAAARLVVERGKQDEVIPILEETLSSNVPSSEIENLVDRDMSFHIILSEHSGHSLIIEKIKEIQPQVKRLTVQVHQSLDLSLPDLTTNHDVLIDALRTNDADIVEQSVKSHVLSSGKRLKSYFASALHTEETDA